MQKTWSEGAHSTEIRGGLTGYDVRKYKGDNQMISTKEVMENIVMALDSKKARNITVLQTGDITVLADYFVICTAGSTSQIKSLSDEAGRKLTELGEAPRRVEGYRDGGWVLMDFGCVIVHIFLEEARGFYDLERLWGDAPEVDINYLTIPNE